METLKHNPKDLVQADSGNELNGSMGGL